MVLRIAIDYLNKYNRRPNIERICVRILNGSDFGHLGLWSKPNVRFEIVSTKLDHYIYIFIN